jgi:hypothetical protein
MHVKIPKLPIFFLGKKKLQRFKYWPEFKGISKIPMSQSLKKIYIKKPPWRNLQKCHGKNIKKPSQLTIDFKITS